MKWLYPRQVCSNLLHRTSGKCCRGSDTSSLWVFIWRVWRKTAIISFHFESERHNHNHSLMNVIKDPGNMLLSHLYHNTWAPNQYVLQFWFYYNCSIVIWLHCSLWFAFPSLWKNNGAIMLYSRQHIMSHNQINNAHNILVGLWQWVQFKAKVVY